MSGGTRDPSSAFWSFVYGAITLYGRSFQIVRLPLEVTCRGPTTPARVASDRFGHVPISLAATQGISFDFFSSGYLDVSVPRVCHPHLCIQYGLTRHDPGRVSPFGNPRIKVRLATPRGISQPATSFIASWRQGIHHLPLLSLTKTARARIRRSPPRISLCGRSRH